MDKPPHGQPCNRCGLCCKDSTCPLGSLVLGVPYYNDRSCTALRKAEDGSFACGLILEPEAYSPVMAFVNGRESLSAAAAFLIGIGHGCDWVLEDEPRDEAFTRTAKRFADNNRGRAEWAKRMWGLTNG